MVQSSNSWVGTPGRVLQGGCTYHSSGLDGEALLLRQEVIEEHQQHPPWQAAWHALERIT